MFPKCHFVKMSTIDRKSGQIKMPSSVPTALTKWRRYYGQSSPEWFHAATIPVYINELQSQIASVVESVREFYVHRSVVVTLFYSYPNPHRVPLFRGRIWVTNDSVAHSWRDDDDCSFEDSGDRPDAARVDHAELKCRRREA